MEEQLADLTSEESVQVFVRIRPEFDALVRSSSSSSHRQLDLARPDGSATCVTILDSNSIRITQPDSFGPRKSVHAVDDKMYTFDRIFPATSSLNPEELVRQQDEIYQQVSTHVRAAVSGYNSTIFAYGSTGSGKSYTMTGNSQQPGIIPRAISEIFSLIESSTAQDNDIFFYVRISYVELYNNTFKNLLEFASKELSEREADESAQHDLDFSMTSSVATKKDKDGVRSPIRRNEKIEVRESQSAGVFLAGPNIRIPVTSAMEAFQLINRGNKFRATGSTLCNDQSSRSHAILTLHVESRAAAFTGSGLAPELRLGKMHLVDLAGSERIGLSGAEGDTLTETQSINLSLTALGDVLSVLSSNANIQSQRLQKSLAPVPYRNSKLTHLLKDSLGGNSKTIMIATIRQCAEFYQQTRVSLMYASRAKNIKNRSVVNRNVLGDTGIHAVTTEIERLRGRLDERTFEFERLRALQMQDATENLELKKRLQELNMANESEKKQLEQQMSHVLHSQAGQLAAQRQKIASLQRALQDELAISQNRIAEQEKEIKWLKTALHESSKEAQQPKEQLEKMQKMLDGWQSQADSTQKELADALKVVEMLRTRVTSLNGELKCSTDAQKILRQQVADLSSNLRQTTESLQGVTTEKEKLSAKFGTYEITNMKLSEQVAGLKNDLEQKSKQCTDLNTRLLAVQDTMAAQLALKDSEISVLREEKKRSIEVLEREKGDLTTKLGKVVSSFEKQTSEALGDAKNRCTDSENRRKVAEDKLKEKEFELSEISGKLALLHRQSEEAIREQDREMKVALTALKNEQAMNASLGEKLLALTQENSIKLNELNAMKELFRLEKEKLVNIEKLQEDFSSNHAAEIAKMAIEHNKLLQEALETKQAEFDKRESHLITQSAAQIKAEFEEKIADSRKEIARVSHDYSVALKEKEAEIEHLRETHETIVTELANKYKKEVDSVKVEVEDKMIRLHNENVTSIETAHSSKLSEMTHQLEHERQLFLEKEVSLLQEIDNLELRYNEEVQRLSLAMKHAESCADQKLAEVKSKYKEKFQESIVLQKQSFDQEKLEESKRMKVEIEKRQELERIISEERNKYTEEFRVAREDIENRCREVFDEELQKIIKEKDEEYSLRIQELAAEANREKVQETSRIFIRKLLLTKARNIRLQAFLKWKNAIDQRRIEEKNVALSVSVKTRVKNTVRWLLMNCAQERRLWAFRNWREVVNLVRKETTLKAALESSHRAVIDDLQHALRGQAADEIATITAKWEEEMRLLSESKESEIVRLRGEIVAVRAKLEAEMKILVESKDSKVSSLLEEITLMQKTHTEDMRKSLDSQLSQLLESHKSESESLRKDKESMMLNYERQLTSTKEANEVRLDVMKAQFEESIEKLSQRSKETINELKANLEMNRRELNEKSNTVDALNKHIEELGCQVSQQLVDLRSQYQKEKDYLSLTHAEEAARLTTEIVQMRENFDREVSELKDVYECRVETLLVDTEARKVEAIENEVKATELRCNGEFDIKLNDMMEAHKREINAIICAKEEYIAIKDTELEKLASVNDSLNSRIQSIEHSLLLTKESHANDLRALAIDKDISLSELTVKSQNRNKDIEDRFNAEIETLHEKYRAEIAALNDAHEEKFSIAVKNQSASTTELLQESRAAIERKNQKELADLRHQLEDEFSARAKETEIRHVEALKQSQVQFQETLTKAKELDAQGMVTVLEKHKSDIESLSKKYANDLEKLQMKEKEARRAELSAVNSEHALMVQKLVEDNSRRLSESEQSFTSQLHDSQLLKFELSAKVKELETNLHSVAAELERAKSFIAEREVTYTEQMTNLKAEFQHKLDDQKHRFESDQEEAVRRVLLSQEDKISMQHNSDIDLVRKEMIDVSSRYKDLLTRAEEKHTVYAIANKELEESISELETQRAIEKSSYDEKLLSLAASHREDISSLRKTLEDEMRSLKVTHKSEVDLLMANADETVSKLRAKLATSEDISRSEIARLVDAERKLREESTREIRELKNCYELEKLAADTDFKVSIVRAVDAERLRVEESLSNEIDDLRISLARAQGQQEGEASLKIKNLMDELNLAREQKRTLEGDNARLRDELAVAVQMVSDTDLKTQYDDLHCNYLQLLQKQADYLAEKANLQNKPIANQGDSEKPETDDDQTGLHLTFDSSPNADSIPSSPFVPMQWDVSRLENPKFKGPTTPLHLLRGPGSLTTEGRSTLKDKDSDREKGCMQQLPWSSPALRSSPTDQLIAAILDGDVQGIRAVVRSKGEDLASTFWKDASKSILPLHRAISGLHFHGNERLLINSLETLAQLGADLSAVDSAGNTAVHKAIQVCTSKCVTAVIDVLLKKGCVSYARNKDGDTPLHLECKRIRAASNEVIELLLRSGAEAEPNRPSAIPSGLTINSQKLSTVSLSPLTLVLQRGADSSPTYFTTSDRNTLEEFLDFGGEVADSLDTASLRGSTDKLDSDRNRDRERARTGAKRVWLPVAENLVRSGAQWSPSIRNNRKETQLHLLLSAYPPPQDQIASYKSLVNSALEAGLDPLVEDEKGVNCIFAFCLTLAETVYTSYPDCQWVLSKLLDRTGSKGLGNADRTGKTVFDIEDKVTGSCLTACRRLLTSSSSKQLEQPLGRRFNEILRADAKLPSSSIISKESKNMTVRLGKTSDDNRSFSSGNGSNSSVNEKVRRSSFASSNFTLPSNDENSVSDEPSVRSSSSTTSTSARRAVVLGHR